MSAKGPEAPVIHDLAGAAGRAKVSHEVILRWIREGLRAMPVGTVGKRGPRDFRIFDSWLMEFMESKATRHAPPTPTGNEGSPKPGRPRPSAKVAASLDNPLGPCPLPASRKA